MEKNDTLRNLLIAASIFMIIVAIAPRLLPPPPMPRETSPQDDTTTGASSSSTPASPWLEDDRTADSPQQPSRTAPVTDGFYVNGAEEEVSVTMGAAIKDGIDRRHPGPFRMRLVLSNIGASVTSATLTDHAEILDGDERYELLSSLERPDGSIYRSLVMDKINIDGVDISLSHQKWRVGSVEPYTQTRKNGGMEEGERISFWVEIDLDGDPAVRLTRIFELSRQSVDSGRHDLRISVTIENLSDQSHQVVLTSRGGLGIRSASMRSGGPFVDSGKYSDDGRFIGGRHTFAEIFKKGQRITLFQTSREDPNQRFSWVATANTYFTCTLAPLDAAGQDRPVNMAEVVALDADGDVLTTDDATVRLTTRIETLQPGSRLFYPTDIYLGEKDGRSFKTVPEYLNRNYYFQISKGFGFCTFTWLVELMIRLLNGLHYIIPDYGLAIIIMVMIVRLLLHPITKKGQVNMVRMQQQMGEFTPKIEELKKKYGNDKARLQQETMKLYREHGINPAGQFLTCLPMVLQMPIWVALFLSLSNNIGMRHQPFNWTWIKDLTAPDAIFTFSSPLPLIGATFNLLPILVSVFMYTQQKLQPKPKPNPNMSDQQRQQQEMMQKMMPMMSIMMLFIFYKMPSGLNLYIMFSSLFGTIEQYRIRKHIKEREAAGTLQKKAKKKEEDIFGRRRKPGKLSFFEKLQKMAADAQKTQVKRPIKGKPRRL